MEKLVRANLEIPEYIIEEIVEFLYLNDLIYENKDLNGVSHLPVTIFQHQLKFFNFQVIKSFYNKIILYQIAFNKLIYDMSKDHEFHQVLKEYLFINKILEW
jgi:hypothetical protein